MATIIDASMMFHKVSRTRDVISGKTQIIFEDPESPDGKPTITFKNASELAKYYKGWMKILKLSGQMKSVHMKHIVDDRSLLTAMTAAGIKKIKGLDRQCKSLMKRWCSEFILKQVIFDMGRNNAVPVTEVKAIAKDLGLSRGEVSKAMLYAVKSKSPVQFFAKFKGDNGVVLYIKSPESLLTYLNALQTVYLATTGNTIS